MLATFTAGSTVLWSFLLYGKHRDEAALVPSWFTLFEDCRVAVETRQPLSMLGLVPTTTEVDPLHAVAPAGSRSETWGLLSAGRFSVREQEYDNAEGTIRSCEVILSDWRRPLSRAEIERLTYAFLERRTVLVAKGDHVAEDPPVGIIIALGFVTTQPDAAGCPVLSAIFANPDNGRLQTITSEQGALCGGGPSVMKGPAAMASRNEPDAKVGQTAGNSARSPETGSPSSS